MCWRRHRRRGVPEARVEQTPVAPQPQTGTSQNPPPTPSIPLDTVMKFLQALNPNLNLEATLAQLVNPSQPTPNPQTTTVPTPQPSPELTTPKPNATENSTKVVESEAKEEEGEEEGEEREETEAQPEGDGEGEKVVEGEGVTEGEVVVDAEKLRAEREREMKTKAGEDVRSLEEAFRGDGSDSEREEDGGRVDSAEGAEEEGEVINKEEKKKEKECKDIMRKSQAPYMKKIEELSLGTRRSRRIAGRLGLEGTSQKGGQKENDPMEISSEEEVPLERRPRGTPTEQAVLAIAEVIPTSEEKESPATPLHEGENEDRTLETERKDAEERPAEGEEPTNQEKDEVTSSTDQEEDEEEDTPLKSRLRSSIATGPVADPAEEPKDSPSKAQPSTSIVPEEKEANEEEVDTAAYERERKRK